MNRRKTEETVKKFIKELEGFFPHVNSVYYDSELIQVSFLSSQNTENEVNICESEGEISLWFREKDEDMESKEKELKEICKNFTRDMENLEGGEIITFYAWGKNEDGEKEIRIEALIHTPEKFNIAPETLLMAENFEGNREGMKGGGFWTTFLSYTKEDGFTAGMSFVDFVKGKDCENIDLRDYIENPDNFEIMVMTDFGPDVNISELRDREKEDIFRKNIGDWDKVSVYPAGNFFTWKETDEVYLLAETGKAVIRRI